MATLTSEAGLISIRFTSGNGKRCKIRLGRMDKKAARSIVPHVGRLVQAKQLNQPVAEETVMWLSKVEPNFYERLVTAGLCEPRNVSGGGQTKLASFIDGYIEKRKADMKPWSIKMLRQCRMKLIGQFGESRTIGSITKADAADFQRAMTIGVSRAYTAKLIVLSKMFFKRAVDARMINESPFADVKAGSQQNKARMVFVDAEIIEKVIAAEDDLQRALVFALARYGGLRIPSELFHLKWSNIDFEKGRMTLHCCKTEHHVGKELRVVPIFPELLPHLMAVYNDVERHPVYVVPDYRNPAANLRTEFLRKLKRLNIARWPKLFQNLRSSRETELCEKYPVWAVCEWLGNTPDVAMKHYLNSKAEYFEAAVAGQATIPSVGSVGPKMGPAPAGNASHPAAPHFGMPDVKALIAAINDSMPASAGMCDAKSMGEEGFEPSKA